MGNGIVAMVAWFALPLQLALTLERTSRAGVSVLAELLRYFSDFTILTNLLVAAAATSAALAPEKFAMRRADEARCVRLP